MNPIYRFVIRAVLSASFAVILTRLFHPEKSLGFMVGLAVLLMALTYFLAYLRTGKGENDR